MDLNPGAVFHKLVVVGIKTVRYLFIYLFIYHICKTHQGRGLLHRVENSPRFEKLGNILICLSQHIQSQTDKNALSDCCNWERYRHC